jgi:hypothetical protein
MVSLEGDNLVVFQCLRLSASEISNNVNTFKFKELFSSCNVIELEKLYKFIKIVSMKVLPPG